jgi:hypothetical protein
VSTKRTPNRLLAAVMAEAGVSNKGLAARVRELAQRDDRPISSDHVSVRRWLDGSIPRGRTSHYVAVALGAKLGRQVTPADLGLASDAQEVTTTHSDYDPVEISQRAWRDIRNRLIRNRADLASLAVELYEPSWRLPRAPMLSQESWLPDKPVALEDIDLEWESNPPKPIVVGQEPEARSLLPLRTRLQAFPSYSSAIRYLSPPALFENRPCYRLLSVSFSGNAQTTLRFGQSCYFDKIDMSEALSHELSSAVMNGTPSWSEQPFRSLISDPYDLSLRSVNNSITTLTIRRDCATGRASFLLLRRDATKVVTGGGEYGLVPGGDFQPASISPDSLLLDLSIWRNMVREYSEELLGQPEHDGSTGRPIDYERWPFFRSMQKARKRGELRVYVLGVALNALSLNATVVTVAVIDSIAFDSLFHGLARVNAEGEIVARLGENKEGHGVPFNEATVNHFLHVEPLVSPTTKGGLSLAWRHRAHLLQA